MLPFRNTHQISRSLRVNFSALLVVVIAIDLARPVCVCVCADKARNRFSLRPQTRCYVAVIERVRQWPETGGLSKYTVHRLLWLVVRSKAFLDQGWMETVHNELCNGLSWLLRFIALRSLCQIMYVG